MYVSELYVRCVSYGTIMLAVFVLLVLLVLLVSEYGRWCCMAWQSGSGVVWLYDGVWYGSGDVWLLAICQCDVWLYGSMMYGCMVV